MPNDDDSVRGVYKAFELSQQPKPAPKPLPPPPVIKSRAERSFEMVSKELKKSKVTDIDPDDIQMDKGDFDGTVNSNVDDYAEFLTSKAKYGDKPIKEEPEQKPQVAVQVDKLSAPDKASIEVTPIDTNASKEDIAEAQQSVEQTKNDNSEEEFLSVKQLEVAHAMESMTSREKEHANAALSDNDLPPSEWDF